MLSGIKATPGFLADAINFIKIRNRTGDQRYYCLSLDEVHIRKQIIFDGKKMKGYADYGNFEICQPNEKEATSASFVMATEVNGDIKTPIAYILTNGCDTELVSSIVKSSIDRMSACGARVLTVTFDGLPSNLAAIEALGGNMAAGSPEFQPYVKYPADSQNLVYFTPDPCHMIKLLRNTIEV